MDECLARSNLQVAPGERRTQGARHRSRDPQLHAHDLEIFDSVPTLSRTLQVKTR